MLSHFFKPVNRGLPLQEIGFDLECPFGLRGERHHVRSEREPDLANPDEFEWSRLVIVLHV